MIHITVKDNTQDAFDNAMRIFKKKVQNDGFMQELRERRYFVKPSKTRHDKDVAMKRENERKRKRGK